MASLHSDRPEQGRGLICLALAKQRVEQLGLQLMSRHNGTRHETVFTTSIEAKEGVSTGISAADRARTISVAGRLGRTSNISLATAGFGRFIAITCSPT